MSRPSEVEGEHPGQSIEQQDQTNKGHTHGSQTCARCQALEAQIAELEAAAAQRQGAEPAMPLMEFKALRLFNHGWAEGWQLRPSPARRQWMNELAYSYQC
jgi:hypothetical protein